LHIRPQSRRRRVWSFWAYPHPFILDLPPRGGILLRPTVTVHIELPTEST
jgi:hypothetical protein